MGAREAEGGLVAWAVDFVTAAAPPFMKTDFTDGYRPNDKSGCRRTRIPTAGEMNHGATAVILESMLFCDVIPRGMSGLRGPVLRESAVHRPASQYRIAVPHDRWHC